MKLLLEGKDGKKILIEAHSLETYDGSEIVLKDGKEGQLITGYLELEVRQGRVWRNRVTDEIAIAHVGPWGAQEKGLFVEEEL